MDHEENAMFTAAFALWETEFRTDPASFLTHEECRAMEVAPRAGRSAIYFAALLRRVQKTHALVTLADRTGALLIPCADVLRIECDHADEAVGTVVVLNDGRRIKVSSSPRVLARQVRAARTSAEATPTAS